jgi:hypothetical protein
LVDSEIPTPSATPASRMLMTPSVSTSRSRCAEVTSVRHSRSTWAGIPQAPARDGSTGPAGGVLRPPERQPRAATAMAS